MRRKLVSMSWLCWLWGLRCAVPSCALLCNLPGYQPPSPPSPTSGLRVRKHTPPAGAHGAYMSGACAPVGRVCSGVEVDSVWGAATHSLENAKAAHPAKGGPLET